MYLTISIGILVFTVGEFIFNLTVFNYIKDYFDKSIPEKKPKFIFLEISTFKGVLERLVLFIALYCGFTPILVVFGALKLGTRLDNKNPVSNDYFLIGNFTSILVAIVYTIIHNRILTNIISN